MSRGWSTGWMDYPVPGRACRPSPHSARRPAFADSIKLYCSFQATFLLRGAELAPRDRNDDGGVGVAYAALSASGADDPLVLDAAASIFPQIAAMKADRPTSRKIRAMPAWISPAVRVPGARQ